MPASVLWRSTVFHFFVKNVDTHETLAGIAKSHFLQARGPLLWGPGTHFESFCLPFWCLFQARAKKWKMRRRLSENPPFSDLEGHFFDPFPPSIRKRSHNIPSLSFLWDFCIILALAWDVHEPTKKNKKTRYKKDVLGNIIDTPLCASGPNNTLKIGRWCVWTLPASVSWRSTF